MYLSGGGKEGAWGVRRGMMKGTPFWGVLKIVRIVLTGGLTLTRASAPQAWACPLGNGRFPT